MFSKNLYYYYYYALIQQQLLLLLLLPPPQLLLTCARLVKNCSAMLSRNLYSPRRAVKRVWTFSISFTSSSLWPRVLPFSDSSSAVFSSLAISSSAFYTNHDLNRVTDSLVRFWRYINCYLLTSNLLKSHQACPNTNPDPNLNFWHSETNTGAPIASVTNSSYTNFGYLCLSFFFSRETIQKMCGQMKERTTHVMWPTKRLKVVIQLLMGISELRSVTCNMGSHMLPATWHRWMRPALTPAR